jgi:hypothetical protein
MTYKSVFSNYTSYLNISGCNPSESFSCGYYSEITNINQSSPTGNIIEVAQLASDVVNQIVIDPEVFQTIINDINKYKLAVIQVCSMLKIPEYVYNPYTNALDSIVTNLSNAQNVITTQLQDVKNTGYSLYMAVLNI